MFGNEFTRSPSMTADVTEEMVATKPMTLIERLRNPAWEANPVRGESAVLNVAQTIKTMEEAAAALTAAARVPDGAGALAPIWVGGNHLASVLIRRLGPDFFERYPPGMDAETALRTLHATDDHDIWVCWSAIMKLRNHHALAPAPTAGRMPEGWQLVPKDMVDAMAELANMARVERFSSAAIGIRVRNIAMQLDKWLLCDCDPSAAAHQDRRRGERWP